MASHGVGLHIRGLTKKYGTFTALDGVDLSVAPGEFMTLLGPSGSGKTTTLNLIAGFMEPDSGSIEMGGVPLDGIPAHRRDIGVVFQNYALFPHMTVAANVAFPLKQRGVAKREVARKVGEMLEIVGLDHISGRYPRALSGGQQQRVALARALVFGPKLLLLDEPLGALDKRLREGLQLEIKRIHREVGVTFVLVTHDQEEALAMSDRIAVFKDGRIEQVAAARDLYDRPQTLFAAEFLGDSNVIQGVLTRTGPRSTLTAQDIVVLAPDSTLPDGSQAALILRPEHLRVETPGQTLPGGRNAVTATVTDVVYLGGRRRLVLRAAGRELLSDQMAPDRDFSINDQVVVTWHTDDGALVEEASRVVGSTAAPELAVAD